MKINHIITEFVQQAPVAVPADDAPPAQGYAIKVHGPFGHRQGGIAAATLWYALSAVFPDRYPPKDYQNYGAQLDSPQARVLNQIHRTGSAVVADGIAGRDLAETLANKLAMFKPDDQYLRPLGSKHVEVVESGLNEAYDPGLSSKLMAAGTKVAQYIFVDYAWSSSQFRTMLEHEYNISARELMNWQISLSNGDEIIKWMASKGSELHYDKSNPIEFEVTIPGSAPYNFNIAKVLKGTNESVDEASRPPIAPNPQNYDSDVDYYNDRDADPTPPDTDADYENMIDNEPDDWFDESKEKVGNMDADAFDAALSRMKKLAGAGPLKTVYDPARRVYKNVPHAVQPAQQPKKAR